MSDPVAELLKEKGVYFTISGKDYLTKCLNPEHTDTNPSFRIDRATGICHCFSCGFKANIFKFYGVLTNNVSIKIVKLKDKLKALKETTNGLDLPKGAKPVTTPFRGISVKTLKEFDIFYTDQDEDLADRIILPIKDIRDKYSAFVGRHTLSSGNPRYLIRPVNAVVSMYPAKLPDHPKSIILVEGMMDMLNLWDNGVRNVVCTFGTSKLYNDTAQKMLPYKVMGVEKVFILYDGEEARRSAAAKIEPLIQGAGFIVEIVKLPDNTDPGDLSKDDAQAIGAYCV